jgi:C4-dicarboxylate-specific signal transduction histidine kinase
MIDRFSLRWRLPAIMALILIGAVVTLSVLAYGAARRAAIEGARERLTNAVNQISGVAANSMQNLTRQADSVARDPSIIDALRNPGTPLTDQARSALRRLRTDTLLPLKVAVLDVQGRPVEGVTPELVREGPVEVFAPIDSPTVHPFRPVDGALEYMIAVPVRDSGRVVGQIIQWRRLTRVTTSFRVISDLIGRRALLLIGNANGTALTELKDTLNPPVIRDSLLARQARVENTRVSSAIPGTPWAWYVEYPYAVILGPIRVLSWQSILVALGVLLTAILAGVFMSRGMTRSLADLTTTAEHIAGGDLTRRPHDINRQDEIGRLARSFGVMADKVHESRDELEHRIQARTADLQTALSQLHDTQDELVRKEKLATIGQLASSVGHELRNPLGVMANAVYILERTIEVPSPKAKQYLQLLTAQIKLSERIVADLLDSARSQSPQRRRTEVRGLLTAQLGRVSIPSNVLVELEVDDGLPELHVDPDQIGQILVNLFTNATQAMDNQPGVLSVRAHNGDGRVHIRVRDTGPGVPPDLAEKIFEPLYTTKARGIGLGLSVSRSLATANRGRLTVTNHPGGGAVFTLDLPAGDAE